MNISYFKSIINTEDNNNPIIVPIEKVLGAIKNGQFKDIINDVRSQITKDDSNRIKKKLPAVLFAGEFSSRRIDGFEKPSNIVCIDFDGIHGEELNSLIERLKDDKYIYSVFKSPSNKGCKALVKASFSSYDEYKQCFGAIDNYFGQIDSFDLACSDISRACYVSWDENLYINKDSETFTDKVDDYQNYITKRRQSSPENIIKFLIKWMDGKGYRYVEGNRNPYMFTLACAMCRYGVLEDETKGLFFQEFKRGDMTEDEINNVVISAYRSSEFGVIKLTDVHPDDEYNYYRSIDIPDFSFDPSRSIVDIYETDEEVMRMAEGKPDFISFGLQAMDKYLVFKHRELFAIVASAKAGKTLITTYLAMLIAKSQASVGKSFAFLILTTETSVSEYKSTMVSFYLNKPFRYASREEIVGALEFINNHFSFLIDDIDHLQILDVYHYAVTQDAYFDCIIVDPISNVEESKLINKHGLEYYKTLYVKYLKFCKKHASIWNIAHTVTSKEREKTVPYVNDAEYGAEIARRCHIGLSFYRDALDEGRKTITECHVQYQRTALTRGGGTTTKDNPLEFEFHYSPDSFGYDVKVDGMKWKDPMHYINKRIYEGYGGNPDERINE